MFTCYWFYLSFLSFFCISNFWYFRNKGLINGTRTYVQEALCTFSMLGIIVFWIIGLFVADHWWHPIAAFGISMVGGSLLGVLVDSILPRSVSVFLGAISPIVSIILTLVAYVVWY